MMNYKFLTTVLVICCFCADAQIEVSGAYKHSKGGWDRKMPTTMFCKGSCNCWVRGDATLDQQSGILTITLQLETDVLDKGPKGQVSAILKDAKGNILKRAICDEVSTGGKPPGKAAIRNWKAKVQVPTALAQKVSTIYVEALCSGALAREYDKVKDKEHENLKITLTD